MSIVTNKTSFTSEKNILGELQTFIDGATQSVKTNQLDLSKTALSLLKTLPTARDAILEYFCSVFDIAVKNYIIRIEMEIATGQTPHHSQADEATISEIHSVLLNFVSSNAGSWSPIISAWSLELLGEISSRYAGRAHVPKNANLNETLQLWMSCRATRTLIDITTQCLTNHNDSEHWIISLLDTSVKHSPNFDWVLAHVGSLFPNTIINRVLFCGLKDFSTHKTVETGREAPKLLSVVGILGHLAASHFNDIRNALLQLFSWSLHPYNQFDAEIRSQKIGTVPFLLQLASMSPTLLKALTTDIRHTLKSYVILQLYPNVFDWCKYFGSQKNLQDLLVNLISNIEKDGLQIITLILDCIYIENTENVNQNIFQDVREIFRDILEHLLQEIQIKLLVHTQPSSSDIKLLKCLSNEITELHKLLLSPDTLRFETATRIISLIGESDPSVLIKSACFLLQNSRSDQHLAMFVRLMSTDIICKHSEQNSEHLNAFVQILKLSLLDVSLATETEGNSSKAQLLWVNLLILLKWEKSKLIPMFSSQNIANAILSNLLDVSYYLGNSKHSKIVSHTVAELIYIAVIPTESKTFLFCPDLTFNLVHSIINYFFMCCYEEDTTIRNKGTRITCTLLDLLTSASKSARVISIRELLERSLFRSESTLFGASARFPSNTAQNNMLLSRNRQQSTTLVLAQRQSSIFHAGVIGCGRKRPRESPKLSTESIESNIELFLRVLRVCTAKNDVQGAHALISLTMVQYLSSDVMYNGLPWPDEEFSKVTIERDLFIRRLFTAIPLLWVVLRYIAMFRPVLCYASVVLRALCATLLHQWNNPNETLVNHTVKLIDVLAIGQLLPPPLTSIRDVVSSLKSNEMIQLLRDCVWNYLRDHIPSPALFSCDSTGLHWRDPTVARPSNVYTDSLRLAMLRNIDKMGDQYVQLFLTVVDVD